MNCDCDSSHLGSFRIGGRQPSRSLSIELDNVIPSPLLWHRRRVKETGRARKYRGAYPSNVAISAEQALQPGFGAGTRRLYSPRPPDPPVWTRISRPRLCRSTGFPHERIALDAGNFGAGGMTVEAIFSLDVNRTGRSPVKETCFAWMCHCSRTDPRGHSMPHAGHGEVGYCVQNGKPPPSTCHFSDHSRM